MERQRIKLMYVVNDFLVGGVQRQLVEQLSFIDRTKFDVSLCTLFTFPNSPDLYRELPSDVQVHRFSFKSFFDIKSWQTFGKFMRIEKPDLVVSSLFFANTVVRVLQPRTRYVVISCEHNTYIDKPAWQQWLDRTLAPRSYRIVAVSGRVASFTAAQERIAESHFVTIPNGIDIASLQQRVATFPSRAELQKEMALPEGRIVILNVARLAPQKNHALLIEGFALFTNTHPEALLLIAGEGACRDSLETQTRKLGIESYVRFLGYRDDVDRLYRTSDVFISTSRIEGFSIAYLEALAQGLPLVATDTAGTDEVLEEGVTGQYIKKETPAAVAEALKKVITAGPRSYEAAAYEAAARFDIRMNVQAYESLFIEALQQH